MGNLAACPRSCRDTDQRRHRTRNLIPTEIVARSSLVRISGCRDFCQVHVTATAKPHYRVGLVTASIFQSSHRTVDRWLWFATIKHMNIKASVDERLADLVDNSVRREHSICHDQDASITVSLNKSRKLPGSSPSKHKLARRMKLPNTSHRNSFAVKMNRRP